MIEFIEENKILFILLLGFFFTYFMRFRIKQKADAEHSTEESKGFESPYEPINRRFMKAQRAAPASPPEREAVNPESNEYLFEYDGQSWDATAVLGVSGDSTGEELKAAYQRSLSLVDQGSQTFVRMAYEHLKKRL